MTDYETKIQQVIEPELQKYRKQFWLEREEGKKIFCVSFRKPSPQAVVVISHGFTENEEKYKEIIYHFLKKDCSVYFMEHCGHGRTYRLAEDLSLVHIDRFERYVEDFLMLANVAKEENPEKKLYLFGHSMGGGIGAAVITRKPDLFQKAVLSSPMIRLYIKNIPYREARIAVKAWCKAGMSEQYMIGYHPYEGPKTLGPRSSSMREDQHDYYQKIREGEPLFHTNAPSYGWVREADRLNRYLKKNAEKNIKIPVLVVQAELDHLVSNNSQRRFVAKLQKAGLKSARLVCARGSRHEVFNATEEIREAYWKRVFRFLTL